MEAARIEKQNASMTVLQQQRPYEYTISYKQAPPRRSRIRFSVKEFGHLGLAAALVVSVGLSFFRFEEIYHVGLLTLAATIIALTMSFLLHEIAHKVVAQRRGLWAEFRLTILGAALTLLSVFSPFFKIISPGAVMISGATDADSVGRISIAGPAVNLVLSGAFLSSATFFAQNPAVFPLLMVAANLNVWIALFNLIPFGMLDGLKIFTWNKKVWLLAFATSISFMAITYWLNAYI